MHSFIGSVVTYLVLLGCGVLFIVLLDKLFDFGGSLFGLFIVGLSILVSVRETPLVAFCAFLAISLAIGAYCICRSPPRQWLGIVCASLGIPVAIFACLYLVGTVVESVRGGGGGCSRVAPQDC
jgi:hypothetical protein